ncbi:hypothetical protein [Companilactobacillus nodensis]|uniref:Uncharacterized protein n=1 Tax=Companilactobacillus nodensis DSM 19682 = JCM 14932 = NBRC 107160 TaxID=1423775 RepID=A0A0R1K854_9LACO|nr:hypothetical protein [Companilactobacillus nodensis]KRK79480.1 hypothetical protein FD03_GL000610 [Companilactobacillus nodensis DSM 19682 = JCM 14932 = NBRC 107160]
MPNKRIRKKHKNQAVERNINAITFGSLKPKEIRNIRRKTQYHVRSVLNGVAEAVSGIAKYLNSYHPNKIEFRDGHHYSKSIKDQLNEDFRKSMKGGDMNGQKRL